MEGLDGGNCVKWKKPGPDRQSVQNVDLKALKSVGEFIWEEEEDQWEEGVVSGTESEEKWRTPHTCMRKHEEYVTFHNKSELGLKEWAGWEADTAVIQ